MLACKFHFIFYFYLPLKTCNFNYSNLLLLINISVGKSHCNHQLQPHQWYLLKLTNYTKDKCLYEVIFFLYSIGYLDQYESPPPSPFCWGVEPSSKFSKRRDLTGSQILEGVAGKERCDLYQGELQLLHKK